MRKVEREGRLGPSSEGRLTSRRLEVPRCIGAESRAISYPRAQLIGCELAAPCLGVRASGCMELDQHPPENPRNGAMKAYQRLLSCPYQVTLGILHVNRTVRMSSPHRRGPGTEKGEAVPPPIQQSPQEN